MIGFIELVQPFLIAGAASGRTGRGPFTGKTLHEGGGHAAHHAVNDKGTAQNDDQGQADTPD